MARSHSVRRQWRRRQMLGIGLAASLLLIGPGAVWADGEDVANDEEVGDEVDAAPEENSGGEDGDSSDAAEGSSGEAGGESKDEGATATVLEDTGKELAGKGEEPKEKGSDVEERGISTLASRAFAPVCEPGYVYGLSENGWIREVPAGSASASNFGVANANGVSSFNGLGIGPGGDTVFAYERNSTASTATIWEFDTSTGTWGQVSPARAVNSSSSGSPVSVEFVAGGVDLNSGNYYFGGFGTVNPGWPVSNYRIFSIWEYDPSTTNVTYKGWVRAGGTSGSANGDLAFDNDGNLFIVRGSGSTTQIISVTGANLQGATGGEIAASTSNTVSGTTSDVNGVAFDASGKAFLGASSQLQSYEMPNWDNRQTVVSKGLNSTDLATCSSPASITIEKVLESGRVDDGDQFELTLHQGSQELAKAVTTGTANGVQEDRIGPFPTSRNVDLTFAESASGTTDMGEYASSYRCYVDGVQDPLTSGDGTSSTIRIPSGGDAVLCQFFNVPLAADITIHKTMLDVAGENPQPEEGWEVEAGLKDVSGSANIEPVGPQDTDSSGEATWRAVFGTQEDSATVTVAEEDRAGFELVNASCEVTHLDGSQREVAIDGTSGDVPGVVPGDDVECVFTNKPANAELTVEKQWVINDGEPLAHGDLSDEGFDELLDAQLKLDGENVDWGDQNGPFTVNSTVQIFESATLDQEGLPACELGDADIREAGGDDVSLGSGYTATLGEDSHYIITNYVDCAQQLKLTKIVENEGLEDVLIGKWALDPTDWNGKLFGQRSDEDPIEFDSGETTLIDDGEYVLSEGDVDGYRFKDLACAGAELEDGNIVTVDIGQKVECTFTNIIAPGSVTWTKVGEDGSGFLAGSEWLLKGPGGLEVNIDSESEAGTFSVTGLPWGEYTLTETKAPAGYKKLDEDAIEPFVIDREHLEIDLEAIANEQREGPALPLTGGIGRDHIYIAGALTALLGMAAYLYTNRRRKA